MRTNFLEIRWLRFILVGALNSAFGFFVFSAVVWFGGSTMWALVAGNLAGLVFNFFSTGGLVFKNMDLARLPKFTACYVSILLINFVLLGKLTPWLASTVLAQAILTLPMAALSYAIMTFWVYKPAGSGTKETR